MRLAEHLMARLALASDLHLSGEVPTYFVLALWECERRWS